MSDGNVRIQVISNDQEAQKTFDLLKKIHIETQNISKNTSNNAFKGIAKGAEKSSAKVADITKAIIGSQGVTMALGVLKDSVGSAFQRFDTLKRYPQMMEKMGFTTEQSERSMRKLSKGIEGLPTRLDEVVSTAQGLAVMTGDIEEATNVTLALNNAFLASGSSSADAGRGLVQYQQMLSAGKVDMQSWRTLQETMPLALQKTAEAFGFAGSSAKNDFYEALKSGHITFDEFNKKLIELDKGTGGFAELAKEGAKGIQTSMQNMKTAVVNGVAKTIEQFDKLVKNVTGDTIAANLDKGKEVIKGFFNIFNGSINAVMPVLELFGKGVIKLIKISMKLLPVLEALGVGFLVFKSITYVVTAFSSIGFALQLLKAYFFYAQLSATAFFTTIKGFTMSHPIIAGITGIATALYGVYKWFKRTSPEIEKMGEEMEATADKSKTLTDEIEEDVSAIKKQGEAIKSSSKGMRDLAKSTLDLSENTERGAGGTKKLKDQIAQINKYIGDNVVQYDNFTKKINLSKEELQAYLDVADKEKELAANREGLNKIAERQIELDIQKKENAAKLKKAQEELAELEWHQWGDKDKLNEQIKNLEEANEKIISSETALNETKKQYTEEQKGMYNELAQAESNLTTIHEESVGKRMKSLEDMSEAEKATFEDIKKGYEEIASAATDMFNKINTESELTAQQMLENLKHNQQALTEWAANLEKIAGIEGIDQGFLEYLRKLGPEGAGAVAELASTTDSKLLEISDTFKKNGEMAWDQYLQGMGAGDMKLAEGLKDMIVTADESLSSAIESAGFGEKGKAIVEGTAKGIDENKDKAVKSATDMAKDIDKGTKDTLGIHSPSTVFAEHGQNLVLGLIQGITKSTAEALNSTRQFSKSVIDTSDNTIREGRGRLFNAGRFIGLGLANGLESTRGSIMATARSIANAAASTMRKALKIKSPSRVGVEIGEFTGEGLDIGLANKIKDVKRTSDMLAMSAVPDVNTKQVYDIAIKGGGNATTTNSTVFNVDKIIWQGKEDIRKTMDEMGWIAGQEKWRLQTT